MNHSTFDRHSASSWHVGRFCIVVLAFSMAGCSRDQPPETGSPGSQSGMRPQAGISGEATGQNTTAIDSLSDQTLPNHSMASTPSRNEPFADRNAGSASPEPPIAPPDAAPAVTELPKLRADLSPQKLIEFLAGADQEMQQVYSGATGIQNNEDAIVRMRQIGKLKLEAAKRLREHEDSTPEQAVEGARGELQSLSHLAALGDLKSAQTLEKLAIKNLASDDPRLVTDSRLVLIGFGIESLQHGKEDAAEHIVELVAGLVNSPTKPGVPAMMVMGQARQILAQYGHDEPALVVRQAIIDLFANSKDPQIAKMAAQLAGSVRFDAIDQLLESAIGGEGVSVDQWTSAAETLMDESSDIMTVQYLAGAALEFEASERDDLAQTTYDLLSDRYRDRSDALGDEARIALEASEARQLIIGQTFDLELPHVGGTPPSHSEYEGKVVLMPFWAMSFPQSLQIMPMLQQIRDSDPQNIAIIGMNLDTQDAPVDEFMLQYQLDFPSYQSVSSPTAQVANEVATRFGMVSMPFVAVLDRQGRVAELDFKGLKLKQIVDDLLQR